MYVFLLCKGHKITVRTSGSYPRDETRCLLANLADGSPGGSHYRSLSFPLQHLLVEDLDGDGREPGYPTLHVISVVVRAIMLSCKLRTMHKFDFFCD